MEEQAAASSTLILDMGDDAERIEIYRRYLQNLNYSSLNMSVMHNYARMFFTENSSIYNGNNTNVRQSADDVLPKPLSNKFDVANSEVVLIILTVVYLIIFITGVLGNVITCIVIARNKGMHTAVNYYLFSLAVSDLLLLISGKP